MYKIRVTNGEKFCIKNLPWKFLKLGKLEVSTKEFATNLTFIYGNHGVIEEKCRILFPGRHWTWLFWKIESSFSTNYNKKLWHFLHLKCTKNSRKQSPTLMYGFTAKLLLVILKSLFSSSSKISDSWEIPWTRTQTHPQSLSGCTFG